MIIFDLDGTLLDTSIGIFNSVRFTEKAMGFAKIPDSSLCEFLGPPPRSMYKKIYGVDEETAFRAAQMHRKYGRERAIYEARVYPGIIETLEFLKRKGCKLAVSTLKSQEIAEIVLEKFKLKQYFDKIVGMDNNESFTKAKTIQLAMQGCEAKVPAVMVGDSQYDWDGAFELGIDFIGVLYGFGFGEDTIFEGKNCIGAIDSPERIMLLV